jgi:hypothetical protein
MPNIAVDLAPFGRWTLRHYQEEALMLLHVDEIKPRLKSPKEA